MPRKGASTAGRILDSWLNRGKDPSTEIVFDDCKGAAPMPTVTICSFNCEWMNDWFTTDAEPVAFKPTFTRDGHTSNTAQTAARTAALIRALDPDLLAIEEGPSRPAELGIFIQDHLSDNGQPLYEFFLSDSGAQQRVGLLYKPGSVDSAQLAPHSAIANLIDPWQADVDGDAVLDEYDFTRTPLVVDATVGGEALQVIVMHTKSNFINNGEGLWNDPATHQSYVVAALKNRRRISTEGMRVRTYLDARLKQDVKSRIIVLGDLNDGPGLDYFEELYLSHNVTDIMVGSAFQPEWVFTHAQHDVPEAERYTAVFDDFVTGEQDKHVLLDHILLSPGLRHVPLKKVSGSGRIRHAEYDTQVVNGGANREDRPSDHRPVSVELEY
jgi:endonuclease/exonuclease/phosphatase family metal-dependent hydrolase